MSNTTENFAFNTERDNDFFTSTIVGLPSEVSLGRAFTKRKLSKHPSIVIHATTAAIWHSDAAYALLKQQIKPSPKTLGLPFAAGDFSRKQSKKSSYIAFLLGFCLCAALCSIYVTWPMVQHFFVF